MKQRFRNCTNTWCVVTANTCMLNSTNGAEFSLNAIPTLAAADRAAQSNPADIEICSQ